MLFIKNPYQSNILCQFYFLICFSLTILTCSNSIFTRKRKEQEINEILQWLYFAALGVLVFDIYLYICCEHLANILDQTNEETNTGGSCNFFWRVLGFTPSRVYDEGWGNPTHSLYNPQANSYFKQSKFFVFFAFFCKRLFKSLLYICFVLWMMSFLFIDVILH